MEQFSLEPILKISALLTGALIGWITVLKPLCAARKARKSLKKDAIEKVLVDDRAYRKTVLDKLDALDSNVTSIDNSLALLQRDNIERAYCMFVIEHGYCPSGMKEAIASSYESYTSRGYNHIAQDRVKQLLSLPEFPQKKEGEKS